MTKHSKESVEAMSRELVHHGQYTGQAFYEQAASMIRDLQSRIEELEAERDELLAEQERGVVVNDPSPENWIKTHADNARKAFLIAAENAEVDFANGVDDQSYWLHELRTLDKVIDYSASPTPPASEVVE